MPSSVFVTGANRGIGLELVRQYAQLGQDTPKFVFAACRSPDTAEDLIKLQEQCKNVVIVKLELTNEASYAAAVKQVSDKVGESGLNLLINNAGAATRTSLADVTADQMVELFNVNAVAPLMLTKAFLPLLRQAAAPGGSTMSSDTSCVINISTGVASITDNDTGGAYSYRTSKAALNMITKNLSLDLKKDGVMVSAVHPGWVKTDMGGPRALTETSECVKTLVTLISSFKDETFNGKFYHYSGRVMPW